MAKAKTFADKATNTHALANLRDIAVALEGTRWWVEAGTLLGLVRDGGLITHDTDIDVGVWGDKHLSAIIERARFLGFEVKREYGEPGRGRELALIRDGVKVDVFAFYLDGETAWHAAWRDGRMLRLEFDAALFSPPFLFTTRHGLSVPAPNAPEAYLRARYGDDWRTPRTDWMWDRDPLCINWQRSEIGRDEIERRWPRKG